MNNYQYNKSIFVILILGFILRFFVAIYFNFNENNISIDSISIHDYAVHFANLLDQGKFHFKSYWNTTADVKGIPVDYRIKLFSFYLGTLYYFFKSSILLGSIFSILAWLMSAIVILRICNFFKLEKIYKTALILIYSFLPSLVYFSSLILREPYQLLFFNLFLLFYLLFLSNNKIKFLLLSFLFLFFLILLHEAFLIFAAIVSLFTIILKLKDFLLNNKFLFFLLFLLIIFYYFLFISNYIEILSKYAIQEVSHYLNGINDSRTAYIFKDDLLFFDLSSFLNFYFKSLFHYFFYPFLFTDLNFKDTILGFENILRFLFFFLLIFNYLKYKKKFNFFLVILITFYFLIESIWSLGTANWGTSVRHHIPSIGILLLNIVFLGKFFFSSKLK